MAARATPLQGRPPDYRIARRRIRRVGASGSIDKTRVRLRAGEGDASGSSEERKGLAGWGIARPGRGEAYKVNWGALGPELGAVQKRLVAEQKGAEFTQQKTPPALPHRA